MSRMVDEDFWQPPVDKKAAVRDKLFGPLGISTDDDKRAPDPPAPTKATVDRLAILAERDGFIRVNDRLTISPTLAKMLHYRETPPAPAAGPAIDDADAEARSFEESRR